MPRITRHTKEYLEGANAIVSAIQGQQRDHSAYQQEMVVSIVNAELRRLEDQTGVDLDAIVDDWRYVLGEEKGGG